MGAFIGYTATQPDPRLGTAWRLAGICEAVFMVSLGAPMFAFLFADAVRRLKSGTPALVVNKTGVVDNASFAGLGLLRWNEIEKMYPANLEVPLGFGLRLKSRRMVVIVLKDMDALYARMPPLRAWLLVGPKRLRRDWIGICDKILTVTADEFIQRLNVFYIASVQEQSSA